MERTKFMQHRRQPVIACVAFRGDTQHRLALGRRVKDVAFHVAQTLQKLFAVASEARPQPVGDHASPGPLEERRAEAPLEIGQLMAERGLGEVELLPGAGERAELRDGDDKAEVANLQAHGLSRWSMGPTTMRPLHMPQALQQFVAIGGVSPMRSNPPTHRNVS